MSPNFGLKTFQHSKRYSDAVSGLRITCPHFLALSLLFGLFYWRKWQGLTIKFYSLLAFNNLLIALLSLIIPTCAYTLCHSHLPLTIWSAYGDQSRLMSSDKMILVWRWFHRCASRPERPSKSKRVYGFWRDVRSVAYKKRLRTKFDNVV